MAMFFQASSNTSLCRAALFLTSAAWQGTPRHTSCKLPGPTVLMPLLCRWSPGTEAFLQFRAAFRCPRVQLVKIAPKPDFLSEVKNHFVQLGQSW